MFICKFRKNANITLISDNIRILFNILRWFKYADYKDTGLRNSLYIVNALISNSQYRYMEHQNP